MGILRACQVCLEGCLAGLSACLAASGTCLAGLGACLTGLAVRLGRFDRPARLSGRLGRPLGRPGRLPGPLIGIGRPSGTSPPDERYMIEFYRHDVPKGTSVPLDVIG